jgi:biopolymer transport protein ExbB/TolQ
VNSVSKLYRTIVLSPVLWGLACTAIFYLVLYQGLPQAFLGSRGQDFLARYCANRWDILGGGWVLVAEIGAFFVGIAVLVVRRLGITEQAATLNEPLLGSVPPHGQTADDCPQLLARLDELPYARQQSYLVRRLRDALSHILRKGSAEDLDQELKVLAEGADSQAHGEFALLRLLIWAIPILGFLGTVIGITMAIAALNPRELEKSLEQTVVPSLGVAFDTTALALTLSMVLMFMQYIVDRTEQRLLAAVDRRAGEELTGRFLLQKTGGHPDVAVIRRMSESVIEATGRLVERQAELWQSTIAEAQSRWSQTIESAYGQVERALVQATSQAMQAHAQQITGASQQMAQENHQHLTQVQEMMSKNLAAMREHQQQLIQQAEVLRGVVEATGGVTRLEEALSCNLGALAASHNFEETLQSLAAVIHLLNARLAQPGERGRTSPPGNGSVAAETRAGRAA